MLKINIRGFFVVTVLSYLCLAAPLLGQETTGILKREQIDDRYKWDLSHIYPDWSAWEVGLKDFEKMVDQHAGLKGTLASGPENIYKAYKSYDELEILLYKVYNYPNLNLQLDNANNDFSARLQQVQILLAQFGTSTSWFYPELLAIPWDTMKSWLDNNRFLDPYRFKIEDAYREQKHVLDEGREMLLSYFGPSLYIPVSIYKDLAISDIKYKNVTLSNGEIITITPGRYYNILATNTKQEDRARAFEAFYSAYHANRNTYASIYNAVLQRDWAVAQARDYPSTLQASLDSYNVPVEVVDYLIDAARNGLKSLHRYHKIRKEKLGLESYHGYDQDIPMVNFYKEYDYDDAARLVYESVAPLGKEYQNTVREAIDNRWIDVFETNGKTTGAFSSDVYGVHPYLLLNYNKTLTSVFTLAHEMGHCMHSYLANTHQPKATADYTLFVGEVASQINEFLLLDYLMEKADSPVERAALLIRAIDDIEGTFYAQALNADFELRAHRLVEQGQPVTAEVLTRTYVDLWKERAGDVLTFDTLYGSTWCRFSHFYEVPYYVYQYATCFAAAEKLLIDIRSPNKKVRQEGLNRYLELLKSGGSDYPMELLLKAGADMSNPETYTYVTKKMDKLVTQLEKELAAL
jgi:oligoendopeptidase F